MNNQIQVSLLTVCEKLQKALVSKAYVRAWRYFLVLVEHVYGI